ncbi:hypothetical protein JTF06_05620 [Desemzia sp. RIT804]|uniref:hypothetical protein n=1 Tax=Desemzia sp. RIT 804 TaxID=2810209 RepID=UPI001950275F|nr:hypothetical protein [Desemzia sp. RIT 804]MBM6614364.1 hypothetical protein [Desemzia sp. RIT 804]
MKTIEHGKLLVNLDKKCILEPAKLILSGESSIMEISFIHPRFGNPFQYELFHLLMDEWKGDRIAIVEDSPDATEYLLEQEGYIYHRKYKQKINHRIRKENGINIITIPPSEANKLKKRWEKFVNQYVLINYDSHLFMTIDQRLFKLKNNLMPYFILAQAEQKSEFNGSWAGNRIGVEPIDTATFDSLDYFEMFRMVGNKTACRLGVEDFAHRFGHY